FPVFCLWWFDRHWPRWTRPHFQGLPLALAFGLLVGAGIMVMYFAWLRGSPALASTPEMVRQKLSQFNADTPVRYFILAGVIAGLHSLLEEYYWRWFVFGWLTRLMSWPIALVLSSLAFMGHHVIVLAVYLPGEFWTAVTPFSLCVAVGGGVWAWLY